MSKQDFEVKKGLNVRDGRFLANENEVSIDGDAVVTQSNLTAEVTTLQTNIDVEETARLAADAVQDDRLDTLEYLKQQSSYDAIVDASGNGDYTDINSAITAGKRNVGIVPGTYLVTTMTLGDGLYSFTGLGPGVIIEWQASYLFDYAGVSEQPAVIVSIPIGSYISTTTLDNDTILDESGGFNTTGLVVGQKYAFSDKGWKRHLGLYKLVSFDSYTMVFDRALPVDFGNGLSESQNLYNIPDSTLEFYMKNINVIGSGTSEVMIKNQTSAFEYTYFKNFKVENCTFEILGDITYGNFKYTGSNLKSFGFFDCSIISTQHSSEAGYYGGYLNNCYLENIFIRNFANYGTGGIDNCTLNSCVINLSGVFVDTLNSAFKKYVKEVKYLDFTDNELVNCTSDESFGIIRDIYGDIFEDTYSFKKDGVVNFSGTIGSFTDNAGEYKEFTSINPNSVIQESGEFTDYYIDANDDNVLHIIRPADSDNRVWLPDPLDADPTKRPSFNDGKVYRIMFGESRGFGIDTNSNAIIMFPNSSGPDSGPTSCIEYSGKIDTYTITSYGLYSGADGWYHDIPITTLTGSGSDATASFHATAGIVDANSFSLYIEGRSYSPLDTLQITTGFASPLLITVDTVINEYTQGIRVSNSSYNPYFEFTYTRTGKPNSSTSPTGQKRAYPAGKEYSWACINSERGYNTAKQLAGLDAIVSNGSAFGTPNSNLGVDNPYPYSDIFKISGDAGRWQPIGTYNTIMDAINAGKTHIGILAGERNNDPSIYYTITDEIHFPHRDSDFSLVGISRDGSPVKVRIQPANPGTDIFNWDYTLLGTEQFLQANGGTGWSYDTATKTMTQGAGGTLTSVLSAGKEMVLSNIQATRRFGVYTVESVGAGTITFAENLPIKNGTYSNWSFSVFPTFVTQGGGHKIHLENIEFSTTSNLNNIFKTSQNTIFKKFTIENCVFDFTGGGAMFYDYFTPYNVAFCHVRNSILKHADSSAWYKSLYGNCLYENCVIQGHRILDDQDNEFVDCLIQDCLVNSFDFTDTRPAFATTGPYVRFTGNTLINCTWSNVQFDNYFDVTANDIVNTSGTTGTLLTHDGNHTVSFDRNLFVKDSIFAPNVNVDSFLTMETGGQILLEDTGGEGAAQIYYSGTSGAGGTLDIASNYNVNSVINLYTGGSPVVSYGSVEVPNNYAFQSYNQYTDSTNYTRGFMEWDTGVFVVGRDVGSVGGSHGTTRLTGEVLQLEAYDDRIDVTVNNQFRISRHGTGTQGDFTNNDLSVIIDTADLGKGISIYDTSGSAPLTVLSPTIPNSTNNVAYKFDTENNLTATGAKIATFGGEGAVVVSIHDTGLDVTGDAIVTGNTTIGGEILSGGYKLRDAGSTNIDGMTYVGTNGSGGYLSINSSVGASSNINMYVGTGKVDIDGNLDVGDTITAGAAGDLLLDPDVADGASAIAYKFDTANALSTIGATIASFQSNSVEQVKISEEGVDLATGNVYAINGTTILTATSLTSAVTSSSLTSVGTLTGGTWHANTITEAYGGTSQTTYTTGDILYASAANTLSKLAASTSGYVLTSNGTGTAPTWTGSPETLIFAASDETTALTAGSAKFTFYIPYAMNVTEIKMSCNTAPTHTTTALVVDVNDDGTTMVSGGVSFSSGSNTATSGAISVSVAADSVITVDINTIADGTAGAGLKIYMLGTRT